MALKPLGKLRFEVDLSGNCGEMEVYPLVSIYITVEKVKRFKAGKTNFFYGHFHYVTHDQRVIVFHGGRNHSLYMLKVAIVRVDLVESGYYYLHVIIPSLLPVPPWYLSSLMLENRL